MMNSNVNRFACGQNARYGIITASASSKDNSPIEYILIFCHLDNIDTLLKKFFFVYFKFKTFSCIYMYLLYHINKYLTIKTVFFTKIFLFFESANENLRNS